MAEDPDDALLAARWLVRRAVREMAPYVPGLQPTADQKVVKLNTNENPYPPSPRVIETLRAVVDGRLRLYPDPTSRGLRVRAAELYGLPSEDWVVPGNGSDEILAILMKAFVDEGDIVAYFQPSYSLYPVLAAAVPAGVAELPLPRGAVDALPVPSPRARIFFLTSPNAPYGLGFPTSWITRLLQQFRGIVVADEAYVDFAEESSLPLLAANPRLVIARSLSKAYSLAGLRAGLCFAHPGIASEIAKVKDSYNLSRLAQAAAVEALGDQEYFRRTRERILATRARFSERLARSGFTVLPSRANFVFACVPAGSPSGARPLYERLLARGFLVRHFDRPGLADGLRISIGTDEDMDALADAMQQETGHGH